VKETVWPVTGLAAREVQWGRVGDGSSLFVLYWQNMKLHQ